MSKRKKPKNGTELMMQSLEAWEHGTRARQISRRVLNAFLKWAVLNGKLPVSFAPPAVIPEIRKEKRIGYALTDLQILSLIKNERDEKWKYVYQLLGVYGLRPAELKHIRIIGLNIGKVCLILNKKILLKITCFLIKNGQK